MRPQVRLTALYVVLDALPASTDLHPRRVMEALGRGMVAIHEGGGKVFVGWRLLGTDPDGVAFNVYRATGDGPPARLNARPLAGPTHFVDAITDLSRSNAYFVRPVVKGRERAARAAFTLPANAPPRPYLVVPVQTPPRAHYTQFLVYDFDGDGRAEVAVKAADGTVDGRGTIFDGRTGAALATTGYIPPRHPATPSPTPEQIQERLDDAGANFRDARTGREIWKKPSVRAATSGGDAGEGPGRGNGVNIDPRYAGTNAG